MSEPGGRQTIAFFHRVFGDVRFISHRDMMRMFERALARARLPVRFTEGFNPHPRLSLPLPRPVGMASEADLLVVDLSPPRDADDARHALARRLPRGVELTRVDALEPGSRPTPEAARYRLHTGAAGAELRARVARLNQSDVVPITRSDPKRRTTRTLDLKEFLQELRWVDDELEFWLRQGDRGTVRPGEVAESLGFAGDSMNHRIRRMEVRWK